MKIINGLVFINGKFEKRDIRITDGIFSEIAEQGKVSNVRAERCDETEQEGLRNELILDATGNYILPGLVDVHTHGREGEDFSRVTEERLGKLLASYAVCGVTSVLGTTMTNEPSLVERSLQVMGGYIGRQYGMGKAGMTAKETAEKKTKMDGKNVSYAGLLGIHMEGPFLGNEKRGAHDAAYLQQPDWNRFERMQKLSGGNIRLLTIDPELCGAEEFIQSSHKNGVKVSLGHTACGYETAVRAWKAGADHVTHVFNGMGPLHHREPGLPGAALDMGMYTELICDGIHVHPAVVRLLFAARPEKMVLISDSISAAGMSDGEYVSGGMKVMVEDGCAVLWDGTIAGSTISLFEAMVNAIRFGVPAEQAVNSATYIPAKSVGMEEYVGSIALGKRADFLVVNEKWQLKEVYIAGKGRLY